MANFSGRIVKTYCEGVSSPLGVENPLPRLSWILDGLTRQTAYQVQVSTNPGDLAAGTADLWDSGRIESSQSVNLPYAGAPLASRTPCHWRVRVWDEANQVSDFSALASWEMGQLEPSDWTAQWIGRPDTALGSYNGPVLPSPLFRKSFTLGSGAVSARAYVCGLGYFELYLNGRRVGDHVLDPIVTQYEKHVGYVTHDVTSELTEGENVIGLMLGNGWYNTHTAEVWHFDKAPWRDYPKLILQLEVTYADGRVETVISDASWQVTDGPIRFDGLRNGEVYDARAELPGWNAAGFDAGAWKRAQSVPGPGGVLFSQQAPPCRVVETLPAVSFQEVKPGSWVFDFGQNLAGWAHLRVAGPAGTEVTLRYGERLLENGELDQEHIAQFVKVGVFQTDRFILAGEGTESYETRFTYHGFQWVQVEGLPQPPTSETLVARVVQSDFAPAGTFTSSDETLNQLQELTLWAYRGNFVGIPTDCPHREKNGWTGDAQLACETGLYNFNAANAYAHWLGTVADAQRASGQLPGIVPTGGWGFNWGSGPAWDSALIVIPWQMYLFRGDAEILTRLYPNMKRYVEFAVALADAGDGLIKYGLGDWCPPPDTASAPRDLQTTAIVLGDCQIMGQVARLFGHDADAARFDEMAARLRASWRAAYLTRDGGVAGDEQTSLGCALHYGLLEPEEKPAVVSRLLDAVKKAGGRPTFGILGAKWVPRALADAGYVEEAFEMIRGEEFPGWVHWLRQGATTLWENWDGEASRNHIMFGDISAWLYRYLGGIRPLEAYPGFEQFTLAPQLVDSLQWVHAEHDSPYGKITSEWTRNGATVEFRVTVPANTVAHWTPPGSRGPGVGQTLEPGDHRFTLKP